MKRTLRLATILLLTAGLAAVGCGDDDEATGNNANNENNVNNVNNQNNENNQNNVNNLNNENNENNLNNENNENNINNFEPEPPPPNCDDGADAPARCADDPDTFEWGTASIISTFIIEKDGDCCFDFNGDGNATDSGLGGVLDTLGQLGTANDGIASGIADGDIALVLEHDGLTDLAAGGDFSINFWLGAWDTATTMLEPTGANEVLIDPASIDAGAQPQAYLPAANLTNTAVEAGPGVITIALDLFDAPISLSIQQARIEADVDPNNSSVEDGVRLTQGRLGGVVTLEDLANALNGVTASCDCLGVEGDLVSYDTTTNALSCDDDRTPANCTADEDSICQTVGGDACGGLSLAGSFTDVDTTGDGEPNAFSLGASFEAYGATINGLETAE